MKCNQCGTEFEGKFCPECGAKAEADGQSAPPPTQQDQQNPYESPDPAKNTKPAKKKPFFLRWWFILLVIIVVAVIALSSGGNGEKIVWDDMVLGSMLPEPPSEKGKIHENSDEELRISVNEISDKQYSDYIKSCKEKGFTIEAESDSSTFNAFNKKGYKLELSHYTDDEIKISLEKPMEMKTVKWPDSTVGKLLPAPKSTKGNFSYEHDDSFYVYIGDTSKSDYEEYLNLCSEKGFNVDYDKSDDHYFASNSAGCKLELRYEGNNIISIKISLPDKKSDNSDATDSNDKDTDDKNSDDKNSGNLDPKFKTAMDSYEKFMDEYVEFMKKYNENPDDLSYLSDYTKYMKKYADFVEDFEKWEDEEMNAAETAYYIEVQTRVNEKLLDVL